MLLYTEIELIHLKKVPLKITKSFNTQKILIFKIKKYILFIKNPNLHTLFRNRVVTISRKLCNELTRFTQNNLE